MNLAAEVKKLEDARNAALADVALLAKVRELLGPTQAPLPMPTAEHKVVVPTMQWGTLPKPAFDHILALDGGIRDLARNTCVTDDSATHEPIPDLLRFIRTGYESLSAIVEGYCERIDVVSKERDGLVAWRVDVCNAIMRAQEVVGDKSHPGGREPAVIVDLVKRAAPAPKGKTDEALEKERDILAAAVEEMKAALAPTVTRLREAGRLEEGDDESALRELDVCVCGLLEDLECAQAEPPLLEKHTERIKQMLADERGLTWDLNAADRAALKALLAAVLPPTKEPAPTLAAIAEPPGSFTARLAAALSPPPPRGVGYGVVASAAGVITVRKHGELGTRSFRVATDAIVEVRTNEEGETRDGIRRPCTPDTQIDVLKAFLAPALPVADELVQIEKFVKVERATPSTPSPAGEFVIVRSIPQGKQLFCERNEKRAADTWVPIGALADATKYATALDGEAIKKLRALKRVKVVAVAELGAPSPAKAAAPAAKSKVPVHVATHAMVGDEGGFVVTAYNERGRRCFLCTNKTMTGLKRYAELLAADFGGVAEFEYVHEAEAAAKELAEILGSVVDVWDVGRLVAHEEANPDEGAAADVDDAEAAA